MIKINSLESHYNARFYINDISAFELTNYRVVIYLSNSNKNFAYVKETEGCVYGFTHEGWVLSEFNFKDLIEQLGELDK